MFNALQQGVIDGDANPLTSIQTFRWYESTKYVSFTNTAVGIGVFIINEPFMQISIVTPSTYIGTIMELVTGKRGEYRKMEYIDEGRVLLQYSIPLSEILVDFYDQLKSRTQGYASLDYSLEGYRPSDLVKLDVLVNNAPVDALSLITHREKAYYQGRELVQKLRSLSEPRRNDSTTGSVILPSRKSSPTFLPSLAALPP